MASPTFSCGIANPRMLGMFGWLSCSNRSVPTRSGLTLLNACSCAELRPITSGEVVATFS